MTCEKTYLFGEVYPKLKEHCREKYGMEFQVRQSYFLQSAINFYQKLAISIDIALGIGLVSKEFNHLAAILHVYAGGLNFMK